MTVDQCKDTGLAALLILLLVAYFGSQPVLLLPAIVVLVLAMAWPRFFRPIAGFWFGFSHVLGTIMSTIILTSIFTLITTPIGLIRTLFGGDSMRRKLWKQGNGSVFVNREYLFEAQDLERPF